MALIIKLPYGKLTSETNFKMCNKLMSERIIVVLSDDAESKQGRCPTILKEMTGYREHALYGAVKS